MRRKCLDLIFLLLMATAISMTLACPKNIVDEATKCMKPVKDKTSGEGQVMLMLVSGISRIQHLCRDGTIQEAFACLNRIYTSCAERREDLERLEMMVGVGKWSRAMSNICNSMEYMADNVECEEDVKREFRPCANRAIILFHHQKREMQDQSIKYEFSQEEVNSAVMEMGCKLTKNILECLQIPYRTYCPARMADIVINAFKDFIPPACVKRVLRTISDQEHNEEAEEDEENGNPEEEEEENEENEENGDKAEKEEKENEEKSENPEEEEQKEKDKNGGGDGSRKNLVYPYNVPVVFPPEVTKVPPVDSGASGGRSEHGGRSRNLETKVRISHASDVARSREDQNADGNGPHDGSTSAHAHSRSILTILAIITLWYCVQL